MAKRKKVNGRGRLRPVLERRRAKIVELAKERGYVTNSEAKAIMRTKQVFYHLAVLVEEGLLRHAGWNRWERVGRR